MLRFGIILALLAIGRVLGENAYNIRPSSGVRRRAIDEFSDFNDFALTHSDDGASHTLTSFFLILFTTNDELDNYAQDAVRMAMNKFLLMELNALYAATNSDDNIVADMGSEVLLNNLIEETFPDRRLETKTGTELEMQVVVTFDNEPSPNTEDVEAAVLAVMSNLNYFITNLTEFPYVQLDDVTEAFRREHSTYAPTSAPVANVTPFIPSNGNGNVGGANSSGGRAISFVAPVMAGATLIALGAYLVFRRKRKSSVSSPKGDMLYIDVHNENYSMDRSLESRDQSDSKSGVSPFNAGSVYTSNYSQSAGPSDQLSPSEADSVFSGVDSAADTLSPPNANNIRSTKSLMSGYTHTSASTIRRSNINEQPSKLLSSPKSYAGGASLFAFSEEEGAFNDTYNPMSPPSMTNSDVSEDSLLESPKAEGTQNPGWCGHNADSEPILADLAHLESGPRDPTPSMAHLIQLGEIYDRPDPTPRSTPIENGSVSYSVFNCAPMPFGSVQPQLEEEEKPEESRSVMTEGTNLTKSSDVTKASDGTSKSPGSQHSAKVSRKPAANSILAVSPYESNHTPSRRASATSSTMSVNSTMETPMRRNFALSSATPGSATATVASQKSANSQKSAKSTGSRQVQLEWDYADEPSVTTMGQMSAQATKIIGSVYGPEGAGSRSLASRSAKSPSRSATSGSRPPSRPTTPSGERSRPTSRPTTPSGERSRPKSPTRALRASSMDGPPQGDGDYVDNLSRPSTPGDKSSNSAVDDYKSEFSCIPFSNIFMPNQAPQLSANAENEEEGGFPSPDGKSRRHGGDKLGGDGSAMYQTNAMHPLDWSYKSADMSVGDSTISDSDGGGIPRRFIFSRGKKEEQEAAAASYASNAQSTLSARTGATTKDTTGSKASASRELINDLVWLEKKIADVKQQSGVPRLASQEYPPAIETVDSLSYVSGDVAVSPTSDESADEDPTIFSGKNDSVMSSIVCRDCYAPPGRLNIVIHSTKDGPAVHTVKEGSSLEGHIFPGDLIISVNNIDTRSYTAEQVMKMMAAKSDSERKITVLHFEEEV
jgi:hypothetical protein